jgi:hypothetical protein
MVVDAADAAFRAPAPDPADMFGREQWHFGFTTRKMAERIIERHGSEGVGVPHSSSSALTQL